MKTDLQIQRTNGWLPERKKRYKPRVSYAINKCKTMRNRSHQKKKKKEKTLVTEETIKGGP